MTQMIAFNRILFPTDFSNTSLEAQRYAISLARQLNAAVHLLHAIEPIELDSGEKDPEVEEFLVKLEGRATAMMNSIAAKFAEAGIETTQEVKVGRRWMLIVTRARELNVDMIVMGTHGMRVDDQQVILGSTSHRVPYLAPCPVMLVRETEPVTVTAG